MKSKYLKKLKNPSKKGRRKYNEWNTIPEEEKRQTRRGGRRKLVVVEEKDVNIVGQKHLLMMVHAPTLFEVDEIIASMLLGFDDLSRNLRLFMHSPFHLQIHFRTEVAKIFHTSNNLAKVDLMTIGTPIAAVSRHLSWHWLSYFCISLSKGLHSLMMVSWWWLLTKAPPTHMYWNSLRVGLFLIVLIMMLFPSQARTLS